MIVYTLNYLEQFYQVTSMSSIFLVWGRFKAFNLSIYEYLDNSGINFVVLYCTDSSLSTSDFLLGYHTHTVHNFVYSRCDLTRDLHKVTKQL